MYIQVKANAEDAYLVNHNCGVRLIAEYVKMKSLLSSQSVIDLCHHCGYLVKLHTLDPTTNGITIFKNRTLYYLIQYQRTGENSISHVPIPYVGENQKLSIQILNQIKRNNGECTCQSEPSLIEFSVSGTEGMFIEKAKLARMEKQLSLDVLNRKTISDSQF
ncbi:uncharacterized protein isoform X2 [Rhodnius prolixus]|uniref:uncharacterized protein isoform X2 n=1 Tax=Rhodnius prolixus TaxID=13249 RepID=UPI003D18E8D3